MERITRINLTDQISKHLQDQISSGVWKPGDKLPSETELAEQLGVSRMSLRNAIQRCNAIGLTETRVGEGTFVRKFNLRSYFCDLYAMRLLGKNPVEINDLRCVLQIASMKLALVKGIDQKDLDQLEKIEQQMNNMIEKNDVYGFHEADMQFHRTICRLCHNEPLYIIYDAVEFILDDVTRQNVERSLQNTKSFSSVHKFHQDIMESVRKQDFDRFVEVMIASRDRSISYYLK